MSVSQQQYQARVEQRRREQLRKEQQWQQHLKDKQRQDQQWQDKRRADQQRYQARKQSSRPRRQASKHDFMLTGLVLGGLVIAAWATTLSEQALTVLAIVGLVVVLVAMWFIILRGVRKTQQHKAIQLSGVDVMDGFVFEKYVLELLKDQGFANARLTEKYDLGVDAIADKDGERWGIQIKRNRNKTKAESVRAAVAALNHYQCTRAMVISNNFFTGSAQQIAESNRCVLIDRRQLGAWIAQYQRR
jgi:restriction system protein